jgi:hypothetical protein
VGTLERSAASFFGRGFHCRRPGPSDLLWWGFRYRPGSAARPPQTADPAPAIGQCIRRVFFLFFLFFNGELKDAPPRCN